MNRSADTQNNPGLRRTSPSASRNRDPIGQVLQQYLAPGNRVLEIASGTGEHAVYLSNLLAVDWWPSDLEQNAIISINAWRATKAAPRVHPAMLLDVSQPVSSIAAKLARANIGAEPPAFDAMVCINMIHISPWSATEGLLRTAGAILRPGGILYLYGPYKRDGAHTSDSNLRFDEDLKSRNPQWGVRDLTNVCDLAAHHGMTLLEVVTMPANNLSVVLQRTQG